ncbi:MAG TPA: transglycosylase SLT domain-containing protein [Polyangia bacterium]
MRAYGVLALLALTGCASILPRRPPAPVPAPTQGPTTPTDTKPGAPAPPPPVDPRTGEVRDEDKPDWMRGLRRPAFNDLPLRWSPRVSRFLEQYRNEPRYREIARGWMRRLPAYRSRMESVLVRHGLPPGLIFVAMIESGFVAGAASPRSAGGFWQFLPEVARGYGLEVSFWVDERRDPDKSTEAAALYLQDLYARFGSWELALAGYNAGVYAVLTSIARYNTNDYQTLVSVESGLPWETTEYVPKVLAVAIVEQNLGAFGIDNSAADQPRPFDTITVGGGVAFEAIASRLGIATEELAALNPAYPRRRTPPDRTACPLRVPPGKSLKAGELGPGDYTLLRVRPGETLARIARAKGVSRDRLREINGVTNESDVTPGTAIYVPRTKKPGKAAAPAKTGKKPGKSR